MKQGRLRILGALVLAAGVSPFLAQPAAAQAKPVLGKLAGVVRDTAGMASDRPDWPEWLARVRGRGSDARLEELGL